MQKYNNINTCLFDFDGTLVDTMGQFADIAGSIIEREYNIPFDRARQKYLDTSGIPFAYQLELLFPKNPQNEELSKEFEERKIDSFFQERFSEDVINALSSLKSMGYAIGISSNNFQHLLNEFVSKEQIRFDYIMGYKKGFSKGKEHFDSVMRSGKISSDNLLFVGDSLKDAEIALDYGIKFVGKAGTFTRRDFLNKYPQIDVIENLMELMEILKK